jgi:hypothetical protein
MRLRRGETVRPQTPSLPSGSVIICAVLTPLSAFRPNTHAEGRPLRCGCADHHESGLIAYGSNLPQRNRRLIAIAISGAGTWNSNSVL